jgi:tetratricopeptide (TPR) repeat protein
MFERAINLNSGNAEAWLNKGFILEKLGEDFEASSAFSKAVQLKPNLKPIISKKQQMTQNKNVPSKTQNDSSDIRQVHNYFEVTIKKLQSSPAV